MISTMQDIESRFYLLAIIESHRIGKVNILWKCNKIGNLVITLKLRSFRTWNDARMAYLLVNSPFDQWNSYTYFGQITGQVTSCRKISTRQWY